MIKFLKRLMAPREYVIWMGLYKQLSCVHRSFIAKFSTIEEATSAMAVLAVNKNLIMGDDGLHAYDEKWHACRWHYYIATRKSQRKRNHKFPEEYRVKNRQKNNQAQIIWEVENERTSNTF